MTCCCVVGCGKRSDQENVRLYRIPKVIKKKKHFSERRGREWPAAINRKKTIGSLENARVCSSHFVSGAPAGLDEDTHPDWVPSLHLGYASKRKAEYPSSGRYARRKFREHALVEAASEEPDVGNVGMGQRMPVSASLDEDGCE